MSSANLRHISLSQVRFCEHFSSDFIRRELSLHGGISNLFWKNPDG
jgi:hypothetical protein